MFTSAEDMALTKLIAEEIFASIFRPRDFAAEAGWPCITRKITGVRATGRAIHTSAPRAQAGGRGGASR